MGSIQNMVLALSLFYTVSKFCGSAPLTPLTSSIKNQSRSKMKSISAILWMCYFVSMAIVVLLWKPFISFETRVFTQSLVGLTAITLTNFATISTLSISFITNHNNIISMLHRMYLIDKLLQNHQITYQKVRLLLVLSTFIFVLYIIFLVSYNHWLVSKHTAIYLSLYSVLLNVILIVNELQFSGMVLFIWHRAKFINKIFLSIYGFADETSLDLKIIQNENKLAEKVIALHDNQNTPLKILTNKYNLENLRNAHLALADLAKILNKQFGLTLLFDFASMFVNTNNYLYVLIAIIFKLPLWNLYEKPLWHIGLVHVSWLVLYLWKVISVGVICQIAKDQFTHTRWLVQKVFMLNEKKPLFELKYFSMQLKSTFISFMPCGFFQIDCAFIFAFFAAVITYIIILLQFNISSCG